MVDFKHVGRHGHSLRPLAESTASLYYGSSNARTPRRRRNGLCQEQQLRYSSPDPWSFHSLKNTMDPDAVKEESCSGHPSKFAGNIC